jgi:endonuclease/exonuclease/phosphatase family metal-dependent hydrolase
MELRLATHNIQNGVGVTRGYGDYALRGWKYLLPHSPEPLRGVLEYIESSEVDVLALNEVEGGSFRSRRVDHSSWVADRSPLCHKVFFPTFRRVVAGRVLTNQGNAILSRLPVTSHEAHLLPGRGEPRFLGRATVETEEGETLSIFTTHLSLSRPERRAQLEAVAGIVSRHPGARLLCGDLNTAEPAELSILEDHGLGRLPTGPTFPSWRPRRCLDHVFVSEELDKVVADVLDEVAVADHLPIVVRAAL